jgi:hypothetical protein
MYGKSHKRQRNQSPKSVYEITSSQIEYFSRTIAVPELASRLDRMSLCN